MAWWRSEGDRVGEVRGGERGRFVCVYVGRGVGGGSVEIGRPLVLKGWKVWCREFSVVCGSEEDRVGYTHSRTAPVYSLSSRPWEVEPGQSLCGSSYLSIDIQP